jgi:hypothetical protein
MKLLIQPLFFTVQFYQYKYSFRFFGLKHIDVIR